ncbi:hypothetical protein V8E55_007182 [Tylopilus felleus]
MAMFLSHYMNSSSLGYGVWMAASLITATGKGKPTWWARQLCAITTSWILYTELVKEINEHLQSVGKYVHARDIIEYLGQEDIKLRYGIKKNISIAMTKHWMHNMDYCWTRNFKGQYVDGHERDDVVSYCQNIFQKKWSVMEENMCTWDPETETPSKPRPPESLPPCQEDLNPSYYHCLVAWFHDESTFYANDHHAARWVKKDAGATPYTKGEGASLMVADFISADHGWLRYFTNEDILTQIHKAMDLVTKYVPDENHVFVFDNATTHLKRPDDALSVRKMPKNISKEGTNWGVEVMVRDLHGKIIYASDGVKMGNLQVNKTGEKPVECAWGLYTV